MRHSTSFRTRLLAIVTIGIFGLALTAALTAAWVTSKRARVQILAEGLQITGNLAGQSVLALLFASGDNAKSPLQAIMGFPSVEKAGIFDAKGNALLTQGGEITLAEGDRLRVVGAPTLVRESTSAWHFVAPVFTGAPEDRRDGVSPLELDDLQQELIGYAYVIMGKAALRETQASIFLNNLLIGLSFGLVLVTVMNFGIVRLTRPLYQLSNIMEVAEREGTHVYANLQGPKEITDMAAVFNRMMGSLEERDRRLRQHQEMLQSEVAIRTQELVEARDAAMTASRHKSEFLANMSHELRTPLQAIIGYSDVVREELEVEGMDDHAEELERVISNAQRLLSLLNNVLGLAKIEAGRMEIRLQGVNLRELAREAAETVQPIVNHNSNRLQTTVFGGENLQIDREKLLPQQCRQIHQGRQHLTGSDSGDAPADDPSDRYRHRPDAAAADDHFRGVPAGGRQHHPKIRGHRPGSGDHKALLRTDGRQHRGATRPRRRIDLHRPHSAAGSPSCRGTSAAGPRVGAALWNDAAEDDAQGGDTDSSGGQGRSLTRTAGQDPRTYRIPGVYG
jgi:signal transduction histidine kinase